MPLSSLQLTQLASYTCPSCAKLLGRYHAYPVLPPTLISMLADSIPMHLECAQKYHDLCGSEMTIVWVVKSSSPDAPSGKLFKRAPEDWCVHLFTPERIEFFHAGQPATYEQIQEAMGPAIKAAAAAATSDEEIEEITRQIAKLHQFFPPRPKPTTTQPTA